MRKSVKDIVREVAAKHGLSVEVILSHCAQRAYAWPRQEAYYRIFTECPHISYPEAARRLGGRDHTTVLLGVKAYCRRNGVDYAEAVRERTKEGGAAYFHHLKTFDQRARAYAQAMEAARG